MASLTEADIKGTGDPVASDQGEIVVCEIVDPDLRRLVVFREKVIDQEHALLRRHKHWQIENPHVDEDDENHDRINCDGCKLSGQVDLIVGRIELLNAIFWQEVKEALPEKDWLNVMAKGAVALELRAGWKVVKSDYRPSRPSIGLMIPGVGLVSL
jgi:hypothetical protein